MGIFYPVIVEQKLLETLFIIVPKISLFSNNMLPKFIFVVRKFSCNQALGRAEIVDQVEQNSVVDGRHVSKDRETKNVKTDFHFILRFSFALRFIMTISFK